MGRILFGDVNPSGKLTVSLPKFSKQFPTSWHSLGSETSYDEGIFVGYRYFDKYKKTPSYPFGLGLSYTSFEYSKPSIIKDGNKVKVSIKITNTGKVQGKEIVQLYINDPKCTEERPDKELKDFEKNRSCSFAK